MGVIIMSNEELRLAFKKFNEEMEEIRKSLKEATKRFEKNTEGLL